MTFGIIYFFCLLAFAGNAAFCVESENCAECHKYEVDACRMSKGVCHTFANRFLSDALDAKPFAGRSFSQGNAEYNFFKEGGAFKVSFREGSSAPQVYTVEMAIGVTPLVQYVVKAPRGAYQVLNIAYDPAKDEFFDVFNGETRGKGQWGHWLSKGMNWNSNCAYCHMTDFKKNYNHLDDSYKTEFSSQGIACAQCHSALPKACKNPSYPVLVHTPSAERRMDSCASCHSRREQLNADKFKVGDDYYDSFRPELPVLDGIYYPDGKVREEDFVYSSFMMSRQFTAGLNCMHCHDKHMMRIARPVDKNALCLTCHAPEAKNFKGAPTIVPNKHSFHKDGDGNLCVNCHMPKTVYMGRDPRYDHGFTSPDPMLTKLAGIPNACSQCHEKLDADNHEKNLDWLIDNFEKNWGSERFLRKRARSLAVAKAHKGDLSDANKAELLRLLVSEDNLAWQATLLGILAPRAADADAREVFLKMAESESPLVRSAAVGALSAAEGGGEIAKKFLSDKSALVRIDSAFALGRDLDENSQQYSELMEYLEFNSDRPVARLKRADFFVRAGKFEKAAEIAKSALELEKDNPELDRQTAIMLFRANASKEAFEILENARQKYPENAKTSYTLALFYGERGDLKSMVAELENTVMLEPSFARAWYNLSVAQFKLGRVSEAINSIDSAIKADPANADKYLQTRNYYDQNRMEQ